MSTPTTSPERSLNGQESAEQAGLRYVTDDDPGIRRIRQGRGFRYVDERGEAVQDDRTLARIRALVIPPAWTDVWICRSPRGHIQVTGRDERGRKQYRYHAEWQTLRGKTKYERMLAFGRTLPAIRRQVQTDLDVRGLPKRRVLAVVVLLLDETRMRVGNESYAKENKSYGLTTLRDRHVQISGSEMTFRFRGKGGKEHRVAMSDRRIASLVKRCQELPGQVLFQYENGDGTCHPIESADVNDYLKEIAGDDYTAKDFRTWAGSVIAADYLRRLPPPASETEAKREIVAAVDVCAKQLGNTRAVCRSSYIHPAVLDAYTSGELGDIEPSGDGLSRRDAKELDDEERFLLALLVARTNGA